MAKSQRRWKPLKIWLNRPSPPWSAPQGLAGNLRGFLLRRLKKLRIFLHADRPLHPTHDGYKERIAQIHLFQHRQVDVVFLGDSIVENGVFPERFDRIRVGDGGVRGDTTFGVLKRMPDIIAKGAPHVFLMAGINDLGSGRTPDQVAENLTKIASLLSETGSRVFLQSVLYSNNPSIPYRNIDAVNTRLQRFAESSEGIDYVDVNRVLAEGHRLPRHHSFDGTHLTAKAYRVWWDLIETILVPLYPQLRAGAPEPSLADSSRPAAGEFKISASISAVMSFKVFKLFEDFALPFPRFCPFWVQSTSLH